MDTGGPQHDVHPSDCTQFTGESLFQFQFILLVSDPLHAVFVDLICAVLTSVLRNIKAVGCVSEGSM